MVAVLDRDWSHLVRRSFVLKIRRPTNSDFVDMPNEPQRILIAERDVLTRASLAAVLEAEGFEVDEAENTCEAVACGDRRRPDLLLLDLDSQNDDVGGRLEDVSHQSWHSPVIVLTGTRPVAGPGSSPSGTPGGTADAFFERPLQITGLLAAIRHLTSESRAFEHFPPTK